VSRSTLGFDDAVWRYVLEHTPEHPALRACRETTASHAKSEMQIAPEQGRLMGLFAQMLGAKRYLEVGVFTGYSCLAVLLAMGEEGTATCCDVSDEYVKLAREAWEEAGVGGKVEVRLGDATETLAELEAEGRAGVYDLAFIDADKEPTPVYYERCLALVRPGGLVMIDNVLAGGRVADPSDDHAEAVTMRLVNDDVLRDERVDATLIPIADGLLVARKR
jgi:predicted O-methyltransferase YrrM